MHQEPYSTLPKVCRQTFGAFARDIVQIIPSRGLRLAGGGHDSGECDLGKPGRGPGIRNPPARNETGGMLLLRRSLCSIGFRFRCALARHLYIFVLVIFIPVMPLFLRLRLTIAMRCLCRLVQFVRLHVFTAAWLLRPPQQTALGGAPHTFGSCPKLRMVLYISVARVRSK